MLTANGPGWDCDLDRVEHWVMGLLVRQMVECWWQLQCSSDQCTNNKMVTGMVSLPVNLYLTGGVPGAV